VFRTSIRMTAGCFLPLFCLAAIGASGCSREPDSSGDSRPSATAAANADAVPALTYERLTNSLFTPELKDPEAAPRIESVPVPPTDGGAAIWGATGRDDQGHVWFAASAFGAEVKTARLFEYDAIAGSVADRGDVLSEARKAGFYRPGMKQSKIHTKIIQAGDGNLYFASSDENPYKVVGRVAPEWGSHLWRLRLPERRWEHLAAFDEGVLALAGGGNVLYGLAFPDHTLIRYNVSTGETRKTKVGSVEGHISRNLLVDAKGRAYVPRLKMSGPDVAEHTLVAFDAELNELGSNPIPYYQQAAEQQPASMADQFHGIASFVYLADGSIVFATHPGRLLRLIPAEVGPGKVEDLGWLHPGGKSYASTLFTVAGKRYIYGLPMVMRNWHEDHDFVCFDLAERKSRVIDVRFPQVHGRSLLDSYLYGSNTRDAKGAFMISGLHGGPVLLRVIWEPISTTANNL
jgi:hypothetical protein